MNPSSLSWLRHRPWVFVLAAVLAATGCSSSSIPKAKLTGKVLVGTEALDGGTIVFVPANEVDVGGGTGPIDNEGNYTATVTHPGKMKVYVNRPTPTPKLPPGKSFGPLPTKDVTLPENATKTPPPSRTFKVGVPKKYTDPKLTDYIVDLEPGTHELNIEFKK